MVQSGQLGATAYDPFLLTRHQDLLFFTATDGIHGTELWTSDGTDSGTHLVADIRPGFDILYRPTGLVSFDHRLAFWEDDLVHGSELWLTDGTPEGTQMAHDLMPGPVGSHSPQLYADALVWAGRLVYRSELPGIGVEIVITDGTLGGTETLDLVPGANSGSPSGLYLSGDRIFFSAMDLSHGRELWVWDLDLFTDGFESGSTSAWSQEAP